MPSALGALGLLALVLVGVLLRARARTGRELVEARVEVASLRARLDALERRQAAPVRHRAPEAEQRDYVITHLGDEPASPRHPQHSQASGQVEPALFADLVLRETVVRVASVAHGLRVALAPESRNRIRFEVRREIRRARKQRRAELKEARRLYEAHQRAALTDDEDAA